MKFIGTITQVMLIGTVLLLIIGCSTDTMTGVPEISAVTLTSQPSLLKTTATPTVSTRGIKPEITVTALSTPLSLASPALAPSPMIHATPTQIILIDNQYNDPAILFYAADGHLYSADTTGGSVRQLTTKYERNEDGYLYRLPQMSPNGRWLALNGHWGSSVLLDIDTGAEEGVGRGHAMLFPTWAPDSQRFAYISQKNQLCLYEITMQSATCPFQAINQMLIAKWSPEGTHIAIATVNPADSSDCCTGQVWLMDTIDSKTKVVGSYYATLEPARESILTWLPDGSGLLIRSETNGIPSTLFMLENESTILFAERIASMSPNGRYFLSESGKVSDNNGNELYAIATQINDPACSNKNHQLTSWAWSPDDERLAYITNCQAVDGINNTENWIQVITAETGELLWQQNIPVNLSLRTWTPNGDYLLLSLQTTSDVEGMSIWRLPANGLGTPEIIIKEGLFLDMIVSRP